MRHDYTRQPRGNWKRLNPGRERVMAEGLLSGCDLPLIGSGAGHEFGRSGEVP